MIIVFKKIQPLNSSSKKIKSESLMFERFSVCCSLSIPKQHRHVQLLLIIPNFDSIMKVSNHVNRQLPRIFSAVGLIAMVIWFKYPPYRRLGAFEVDGSNGNDWSCANYRGGPCRTIKQALALAQWGETVFVRPGQYDEYNLVIPDGVNVYGIQRPRVGTYTAVQNATIFIMGQEARLSGFVIHATIPNQGKAKLIGVQFPSVPSKKTLLQDSSIEFVADETDSPLTGSTNETVIIIDSPLPNQSSGSTNATTIIKGIQISARSDNDKQNVELERVDCDPIQDISINIRSRHSSNVVTGIEMTGGSNHKLIFKNVNIVIDAQQPTDEGKIRGILCDADCKILVQDSSIEIYIYNDDDDDATVDEQEPQPKDDSTVDKQEPLPGDWHGVVWDLAYEELPKIDLQNDPVQEQPHGGDDEALSKSIMDSLFSDQELLTRYANSKKERSLKDEDMRWNSDDSAAAIRVSRICGYSSPMFCTVEYTDTGEQYGLYEPDIATLLQACDIPLRESMQDRGFEAPSDAVLKDKLKALHQRLFFNLPGCAKARLLSLIQDDVMGALKSFNKALEKMNIARDDT
jgi:hypothetical protein